MSRTLFLSAVTNEFGALRRRLAELLESTKRVHVRHQDAFPMRGLLTLDRLATEIERSDGVLHIIGAECGASPPTDQVAALLARFGDFEPRFPDVATAARSGQITYTQWEAW